MQVAMNTVSSVLVSSKVVTPVIDIPGDTLKALEAHNSFSIFL